MYAISNWASKHKWASRAIVILLNFILYGLAMYLALLLQKTGDIIPVAFWGWVVVFAFSGALITGRINTRKIHPVSTKIRAYWQRRLKYAFIGIGSFALVVFAYQSNAHLQVNSYAPLYGSFVSKKSERKEKPQYSAYEDKMLFYKDLQAYYKKLDRKELRKELREARKNKMAGNNSSGNAGYIVLIILGAIVAVYLLAALSCSIACSGSDGLAVVVFIVGIAGIVLGIIALAKGLQRRRLNREAAQARI